ncbi:hypothetical protein AVEN_82789-1 [Araneus ventricosus]|uniref:DNA helicase Pif1-like 2B domain-containing protein n=1 Tax=Araneus ventricosus TaxID=182803 RepID=A0A4Y2DBW8_ARAVE|nr:hypothetical protein AVEN_82789-1 [Araneus ventricosus]
MWLLNIGSRNLPEISGLPCDFIETPQQMVAEENPIEAIYSKNFNDMEVEQLEKRVILAPTNKETLEMNREIIAKLQGETHTFYSSDSIISEDQNDLQNYPPEFLHDLTPSGMPPHALMLKNGVIVMLLRNLNPKQGLCNATRLLTNGLHENFIRAKIVSECNRGGVVFLPRIELAPSDVNLPFVLKSRQFPLIPAYAMTINKSQGKTLDQVGIYFDKPVFSHVQLYVALARSRNPNHVKIYTKTSKIQEKLLNNEKYFTRSVVYQEVFE